MNPFVERYKKMGFEYKPIVLKKSFRVNTSKIQPELLISRLKKKGIEIEKIPFLKHGYWYESSFSLGASPEYLLGFLQPQEAASQIPVEVLNPKGVVWDMCAAPGSKTSQLAIYAEAVIATDINKDRLFSLNNNLERLSIKNVSTYVLDANKVNKKFDFILLDAPCSGNFLSQKDWFIRRTLKDPEKNSELQKELFAVAIKNLNNKGTLVYSTCSLEPEEDELVIDWALNNFKIELEEIDIIGSEGITEFNGKKLNEEIKKCRRIWPDKTQGFFIAKIKKCSNDS